MITTARKPGNHTRKRRKRWQLFSTTCSIPNIRKVNFLNFQPAFYLESKHLTVVENGLGFSEELQVAVLLQPGLHVHPPAHLTHSHVVHVTEQCCGTVSIFYRSGSDF
jgi:hypothetical protein